MSHVHRPAAWGMHDCTLSHSSHCPGLHVCHYFRSQAHCMHWLRSQSRRYIYIYALSHIIFPTFRDPCMHGGAPRAIVGAPFLALPRLDQCCRDLLLATLTLRKLPPSRLTYIATHIQTLSSASAGRECMCAYKPCLSVCAWAWTLPLFPLLSPP